MHSEAPGRVVPGASPRLGPRRGVKAASKAGGSLLGAWDQLWAA